MARFQELDGASGKGKVVMDDGRVIFAKRSSSFLTGVVWKAGGCQAASGNGLARKLQRNADRKPAKGKKKAAPSIWDLLR